MSRTPVTSREGEGLLKPPQRIGLTRWKYVRKFRPYGHREPVVMGQYCLCTIGCAVSVRRAMLSVQLTQADGRRPGEERPPPNNTCESFIKTSFNACLKVMFRQDNRRTPVT